MKNKNLIIGIIVTVAAVAAFVLIKSPAVKGVLKPAAAKVKASDKDLAKTPVNAPVKSPVKEPAKKVFSKDMGGLTAKMLNSKSKEISARVRAFRAIDDKSSIYAGALSANRMQEFSEGSYDIEIDTVPQKLYKNIKVQAGKETIADLGATGAVNVKAQGSNKKDASYQVKVSPARSKVALVTGSTNRSLEIIPGVYDIEIGMIPAQFKKDVKVDSGKETVVDLGCATGSLSVKASDDSNKELRYGVRIKKAGSTEMITSWTTNRPLEIAEGVYDIDVLSNPVQSRKDIKVNKAEETVAEFKVSLPQAPAQPAKAVVPPQAKK